MKNIYFIGIGGIGMSALARYFRHEGYAVAGYDRTETPLTRALESEGIAVHYADDTNLIDARFLDKKCTRVVYTPAVAAGNTELSFFRREGFEVIKRSAILGILARDKYVMAVAGTHGKTTTSTMVAWFNSVAAGEGSAFLGGVSKNFGTNMVLGSGDRLAVEADEFDRSFLQLFPDVAVITSTDADHLDIYGDHNHFRQAFDEFAEQIKHTLIMRQGLDVQRTVQTFLYSLDNPTAHYYARNITLLEGGYYNFDIVTPTRTIENLRLGIPGLINVENCVAAVAMVDQRGFDTDKLREAVKTFSGVARRFDFWINTPQLVYMDDYAHHPAELRAMLSSARRMFPGRRITIIFQPHLYTRTRDFAAEFAASLSLADHVILMPIYPARELPIEGVSSKMIYDLIDKTSKEILEPGEILDRVCTLKPDVLITAGAGNIDMFCKPIYELLSR